MADIEVDLEILELMAQNEELVSQLYAAYAQKFASHRMFWETLVKDETNHAFIIRQLAIHYQSDKIALSKDRFNQEAVLSFSKYLKNEIERAQKENLNLVTALSIALNIEKGLIENSFFQVFTTDEQDLKDLLDNLRVSTQGHYKKIEVEWNRERSK